MMKSRAIDKQKQLRAKAEVSKSKGKGLVGSTKEYILTYEEDNIRSAEPNEDEDSKSNEVDPLLWLVDEFKLFIKHKAAEDDGKRKRCNCGATKKDLMTEGE